MQLAATDMSSSLGHLFSRAGQAKSYAEFRPDYLQSGIFAALDAYAGPPQLNVALDVATGAQVASCSCRITSRLLLRLCLAHAQIALEDGTHWTD